MSKSMDIALDKSQTNSYWLGQFQKGFDSPSQEGSQYSYLSQKQSNQDLRQKEKGFSLNEGKMKNANTNQKSLQNYQQQINVSESIYFNGKAKSNKNHIEQQHNKQISFASELRRQESQRIQSKNKFQVRQVILNQNEYQLEGNQPIRLLKQTKNLTFNFILPNQQFSPLKQTNTQRSLSKESKNKEKTLTFSSSFQQKKQPCENNNNLKEYQQKTQKLDYSLRHSLDHTIFSDLHSKQDKSNISQPSFEKDAFNSKSNVKIKLTEHVDINNKELYGLTRDYFSKFHSQLHSIQHLSSLSIPIETLLHLNMYLLLQFDEINQLIQKKIGGYHRNYFLNFKKKKKLD